MFPGLPDITRLNDAQLLQQADRCVKCGLCLAVCPTYRLLRQEADSPRGRISLIQALLQGELGPEQGLETHLRRCLHCLNCQKACPSGVEYNRIIDAGLAKLPARDQGRLHRLATWPRLPWARALPALLGTVPLHRLARRLTYGTWRRSLELLPDNLSSDNPGPFDDSSPFALFTGCITSITDNKTLTAFTRICHQLSLPISLPKTQGCCGAMHQHSGLTDIGEAMQRQNAQAFIDADIIVSLSSGCGAQLRQHFGPRLMDGAEFVLRHWQGSPLDALPVRVAVHTPCSLRNGLDSEQAVWQLLERIPGIHLTPLENSLGCCGGAGLHLTDQAELADALMAPLLAQIHRQQPDFIVTSNTGCALHLKRALQLQQLPSQVLHPLELIARQLPSSTMATG
jgi:glycolate oxidase iron-sulfur subunit